MPPYQHIVKTVLLQSPFDVSFNAIALSIIANIGALGETKFWILQDTIASQFLDRLLEWTKNIKISDPLEEDCKLGPVISRGQVKKLCH